MLGVQFGMRLRALQNTDCTEAGKVYTVVGVRTNVDGVTKNFTVDTKPYHSNWTDAPSIMEFFGPEDTAVAEKGKKFDKDKPQMDLLPPRAMLALGKVLTHGAKKYGPENWRSVEGLRNRYFAAALRHMFARAMGEELDPESGLPHLAHALCSLAFVLEDELEERDV